MALTHTALTSNFDATGATSHATASITPSASQPVYIAVYAGFTPAANAAAPTGITGAGLTFTKITERLDTTNGLAISVWRALEASPSSGALTISFANATSQAMWSVLEVSGADTTGTNGSGSVVQSATNADLTGAAAAITTTLSAFGSATNGAMSAALWVNTGVTPATATADTGWTEVHEVGFSDTGPVAFTLETQFRATSDTSSVTTFSANGLMLSLAFEIKEAGGAPESTIAWITA